METAALLSAAVNALVLASGDAAQQLRTAALLRCLRGAWPQADITVALPPSARSSAGLFEPASHVIYAQALQERGLGRSIALWWRLRRRRCDVVFICSIERRLQWLAFWSGAPRRCGFSRRKRGLLLTDRLHPERGTDADWLLLAACMDVAPTAPPPQIPKAARRRVETILSQADIGKQRPVVALGPGSDPGRASWSGEYYAHLGNEMALRHGAAVVLVGSEHDRPAANTTIANLAATNVDACGALDTLELCALLQRSTACVSGSSEVLELARQVDTPTVGIFGHIDSSRPLGSAHTRIYSLSDSVDGVRVDDVLAAIEIDADQTAE